MKRINGIFLLLLISSIVIYAGEGKKYGKELSLKETTKITDILKSPESFEGKRVLVEGTVVGVCEKMGCWIEVAGENPGEKIKVKVKDGEIVFPLEAKGKKALVEGEVYSYVAEMKEAECKDKPKDGKEKSCCSSDKKEKKIYQIKGIGAVIK